MSLEKTQAIVLLRSEMPQGKTLVLMYTEKFGRQSYVIRGLYAKKSLIKNSFLEPLSLLEIVVETKNHYLKEINCVFPFTEIPFSAARRAVALFLAEILSKVLC